MSSYVYVLYADDLSLIKIGWSNCIGRRIKELNQETANPFRLKLLSFKKFDSDRDAYTEEQKIHRLLEDHRYNKEFFKVNDQTLSFVNENLTQADPIKKIVHLQYEKDIFLDQCHRLYELAISKIRKIPLTHINSKYHDRFIEIFFDCIFHYSISKNISYTDERHGVSAVVTMTKSLTILNELSNLDKDIKNNIENSNFHTLIEILNFLKNNKCEIRLSGKKFLTYKGDINSNYQEMMIYSNVIKGYEYFSKIIKNYIDQDLRFKHPIHKFFIDCKFEELTSLTSALVYSNSDIKTKEIMDKYILS